MSKNREVPILGTLSERELSDYARFFEKNRLDELTLEEKGLRVTLRKQRLVPVVAPAAPAATISVAAPAPQAASAAAESKPEKKAGTKEVRSPIVGTYYGAPSPGAAPYVKIGDMVTPETKVCIVEAMKVMNEITAGVSGKVVDILCTNGQSVSASQVLMYVE
jgi:acetyl-CoA carboxylase biotin carboxyl carrier protein